MARFDFPHFEFLARFARNRGALLGACLILLVALVAVLAPLFFPADPLRIVGAPELWPGEDPAFPLGTDSLGRDILAMIVHGARATLLIGLFASAVATLIGVTVGAIAGYFGGWVDETAMRAAELFQTIPRPAPSFWRCATASSCRLAAPWAWATPASSWARSCPMHCRR